MRDGSDRLRFRRLAKHHGAAFAGKFRGQHHLAAFARDLVSRHLAAGDLALLGAEGHRSAADRFAPARPQITEHDPVMGAEANDLPRIDISMNCTPGTLPWISSTTAAGDCAEAVTISTPALRKQNVENGAHRICPSTLIAARQFNTASW
jgi:hypothetical protein